MQVIVYVRVCSHALEKGQITSFVTLYFIFTAPINLSNLHNITVRNYRNLNLSVEVCRFVKLMMNFPLTSLNNRGLFKRTISL